MAIKDDLQQAYLFRYLPDADLERIAASAREITCEPGEFIYLKGDEGRIFYVIAEGKVELIDQDRGNADSVYGHVSAGGHFGEVSLFTGKPRSLSVRSITRARLLLFDQDVFESVLLANPLLHRAFDRALAERLALSSGSGLEFGKNVVPIAEPVETGSTGTNSFEDREAGDYIEGQKNGEGLPESIELTKKIRKRIQYFAAQTDPLLITGETGTGRQLTAKQVHLYSAWKSAPYVELDLRRFDPWIWEGKLFGHEKDAFPYAPGRQLGIFEQLDKGTVVLAHAELLGRGLQKKLYDAVKSGRFSAIDGRAEQPFRVRLILITDCDLSNLEKESVFIPELLGMLSDRVFSLPPLREHKRDIPPLVEYYLKQYSSEYNKRVTKISPDALGLLMKYDWPGNLTELSNVIQRAVMVTRQDEIISEQILLGLPRTEGRLVYNLLRIPAIRRFIENRLFPILPKIIISVLFLVGILTLFLGPIEPEKNLGLTLSWYIGWPLLIISFFFLPRFWCSICALSAPGKLVQWFLKPVRRVPAVITTYSGWIMAVLCLVVFWVEIVWNAYEDPWLTGIILLSITFGALLFSALFQRYTWCRYICPLGALNAIFSMPSILEIRANRQMCENQCDDHACYTGTLESPGCPMFRHPFLVDNNRDCILCGRCIKNCRLHSTQLNLRIAPQELWSMQTPRLADSFLIVSLSVVYYLLAGHVEFQAFINERSYFQVAGFKAGPAVTGSLIFWSIVAVAWSGYSLLCWMQAAFISEDYQRVRAAFGYGLIPLVLGGYLAFYAKMFIQGAWRLVPNLMLLFGVESTPEEFQFMSGEGISTLLHISILGGLIACLFATYKIFRQMKGPGFSLRHLVIPFLFIFSAGFAYLLVI